MSGSRRQRVLIRWLHCAALLISVTSLTGPASTDQSKLVQKVQQRLALAGHLIERMHGIDRLVFTDEWQQLRTRLQLQIDEALANDANAFFGRVVSRYREMAPKTVAMDTAEQRRRYLTKLSEVTAFRESFEALVAERGDDARLVLDGAKLAERIARAGALADKGAFTEAYSLVDGANHQLITALQVLRDKETVEYRLEFSSPDDEYAYENRRFESQKMLLDMVIAEKEPAHSSMQLINGFVAVAKARMQRAKDLAESGLVEQAIDQQEQAIDALTSAMRVAGVYF